MENYRIALDKSLKMKLVEMYGKKGMFAKAEELLRKWNFVEGQIENENVSLMMLKLYVEFGDEKGFVDALKSVQDGLSLACQLICKFARKGSVKETQFIHERLVEFGFQPDVVTISIYINALTKHGKYEGAENVIYNSFRADVALDTIA